MRVISSRGVQAGGEGARARPPLPWGWNVRVFLSFPLHFPTVIQIIRPPGCQRSLFYLHPAVFSSFSNRKGLNPAEKDLCVWRR